MSREMLEDKQLEARRVLDHAVEDAPRRVQHMTGTVPLRPDENIDGRNTAGVMAFVDSGPAGTPFFLDLCWQAPHPPYFVPEPYDTMYVPSALTYPALDPPDANKPLSHRQTAIDMGTWDAPEDERRRALAFYYGMVSMIDDQVARILDYLGRRGRLGDTIVVYTSDHGDYAGKHRLFGKSATL